MTITGVAMAANFSSSSTADGSLVVSRSSKTTPRCERNSFALPQNSQPGWLHTVIVLATEFSPLYSAIPIGHELPWFGFDPVKNSQEASARTDDFQPRISEKPERFAVPVAAERFGKQILMAVLPTAEPVVITPAVLQ